MTRRHGFTLIEMLMVVVIVSLTTLIALPKFRTVVNRSNLLSARAKVMSSFAAARAAAASSGRTTTMHLAGNKVYVTATPRLKSGTGTLDTIVLPKNVYTLYGVTTTSSTNDVVIGGTGLGSNASDITVILANGSLRDTVRISKYGRVKK